MDRRYYNSFGRNDCYTKSAAKSRRNEYFPRIENKHGLVSEHDPVEIASIGRPCKVSPFVPRCRDETALVEVDDVTIIQYKRVRRANTRT